MIAATSGKEEFMKRNAQNKNQDNTSWQGYTQPQAYPQAQGYQPNPAYPQGQGYQPGQSYPQNSQGYPQGQGYQPNAAYPQTSQGYTQNQAYTQSQGYTQNQGYTQGQGYTPGYTQPQAGYTGAGYPQQGTWPQQQTGTGYPYSGNQQAAGSYIPQTPYSQGYTSPGYQAGGYSQGYNAYTQMGRAPQAPVNPLQEPGGQVPLNGGGYVPQPVPVRKRPFEMTDTYLLILSALLLGLFALGMFVPGLGLLKWVFLILAAGAAALLWLKPMTDNNKRLCFSIVFGLLALVTVIGFVTGGSDNRQTDVTQTGNTTTQTAVTGQAGFADTADAPAQTAAPAASTVTATPEENGDYVVLQRLRTFFDYWQANRQDDMLTLCSPSWAAKEENPKQALFGLMANRTPKNYQEENISGTSNDTSRTVTVTSLMDRNNGKDPVKYRLSIIMDKEPSDDQWYVNPKSLQTYENADTPDPSITNTPAPTEEPAVYPDTVLYYNPDGGSFYHRDQNCKKIAEKFLPLKGHFTYAEINDEKYQKLNPCVICGAPPREQ